MIDVKSLKIANWINTPDGCREVIRFQQTSITVKTYPAEIHPSSAVYNFKPEECSPIDISPDILSKAGFKKELEHWIKDGVKIYNDGEKFYHMSECFLTHFDSVHHLQNWYYFNTMEELTITL